MKLKRIFIAAILVLMPLSLHAEGVDTDADGISDSDEENMYFTDPTMSDTDGDGYLDGEEIEHGYSPLHGENMKLIDTDSDKDYLNDAWELILGTGIMNPDTDGDLYLDGTEVAASYDPHDPNPVQLEKLISVDLQEQKLTYSFGEKILGSFLISSGLPRTPTPTGSFTVLDKVPIMHYGGPGYDYPNTKWNLHFTTNRYRYFIHGAWWHNNFGTPMSHGCVNVSYEHMEPLYWFAQHGTKIQIQ